MAISRCWTERQTTPFSEMAGGRGEVRNCLCSAKWRTGDDGQGAGGREGCWLFALAVLDRLSLESRSAERFFVHHSKCKFMSSSFFFPSSPLPKYRRPSRRTDGWMDGGRALNEDGDEEARLPCPAHPPRSSLPPSVQMCARHCVQISNAKTRIHQLHWDRHCGLEPARRQTHFI